MTAPLAVLTKNSFKVKTRVIIIMYVVADYNLCILKNSDTEGYVCTLHSTPATPTFVSLLSELVTVPLNFVSAAIN